MSVCFKEYLKNIVEMKRGSVSPIEDIPLESGEIDKKEDRYSVFR